MHVLIRSDREWTTGCFAKPTAPDACVTAMSDRQDSFDPVIRTARSQSGSPAASYFAHRPQAFQQSSPINSVAQSRLPRDTCTILAADCVRDREYGKIAADSARRKWFCPPRAPFPRGQRCRRRALLRLRAMLRRGAGEVRICKQLTQQRLKDRRGLV